MSHFYADKLLNRKQNKVCVKGKLIQRTCRQLAENNFCK